ncbi:MAG: AIR synthase-related protein [Nanobdellota archaeon]
MADDEISLDEYHKKFQEEGDDVSSIMAKHATKTWDNDNVRILAPGMGGVATVNVPEGYIGVVHSATGDSKEKKPGKYTESLIEKLVNDSKNIRGSPLAFSCVVDSHDDDKKLAEKLGETLENKAREYDFAYLNGEWAKLGDRVNNKYRINLSGMMISIVPFKFPPSLKKGTIYRRLDDNGPFYMNSDGVGTKPEFSERAGIIGPAVQDSAVMKTDDAGRVGSEIKAMQDILELSSKVPMDKLQKAFHHASFISETGDFAYDLLPIFVDGRLQGFDKRYGHNVSGNVVGKLNEDLYDQLNSLSEGDYLIAISSDKPNTRSNGISARRSTMKKHFGDNYHKRDDMQPWMEYLTRPSTFLYPAVMELAKNGYATFFTHMSGGSFEGKLQKKLAKHDLGAELHNIFHPSEVDKEMIELDGSKASEAYRSWPMGNDGFIATRDPDEASKVLDKYGLKNKVVGRLEQGNELTFKAYNGERITYK